MQANCGLARKTLGMSEYAERFARNGIDISVLSDLTDQDLKGHRRFARPSPEDFRAIADLKVVEKNRHPVPIRACSILRRAEACRTPLSAVRSP